MLAQLMRVLPRRVRTKLAVATVGSIAVALLDGLGLLLVLPLVNLATGQPTDTGILATVSDILGNPSRQGLTIALAVAVVILFVVKDIGSLAFSWWLAGFIATERVTMSSTILRSMLTAPYANVSTRSSAEMMRAMDGAVFQVFSNTINGLMLSVSSAVSAFVILVSLLVLAPLPTVALILYFGIASLAFDRVARPRARRAGIDADSSAVRGLRAAFAALGGIKEIKLRGTHEHFVRQFHDAQMQGARATRIANFIGGMPKYLLEILFIIAIGLLIVLPGGSAASDADAPASLIALFVAAGFRLLPAITSLLSNAANIRFGAPSLIIVDTELAAMRSAETRPASAALASPMKHPGEILIEQVTFRYSAESKNVLNGVSLTIPPGSSVALVGPSGSGKTTLVDIVVGLLEPTAGALRVGGLDLRQHTKSWQRNVAYVAQDTFLLEASLCENIAFDQAPEAIDRERVMIAARAAQLGDVVDELPHGIDTLIGERGANLSGGQRQRVGIARALYRQCQVLVLDEATASLDNETEFRVGQALAGLHGSVTVIIIAHRLSTVKNVDQLVFMTGGRVMASGTFAQVLSKNADFAHLVELGSTTPGAAL